MTPHILILGGGLSGLLTAFRLLPYGFRLSILERNSPGDTLHPTEVHFPVWHGFYHASWTLLQELGLTGPSQTFQPASLEITSQKGIRIPLPRFRWCSRYHLIPELLLFRGLPWSDRWNLLNFLERTWEGQGDKNPIPDTHPLEEWVTQARQSSIARKIFWNPLCQWLLHGDCSQSSLRSFVELLSRYARSTYGESQIYLAAPSFFRRLKTEFQELLKGRGVNFYSVGEYSPFQFIPSSSDTLHLQGEPFLQTDAYVAALAPSEIFSLLPERAITKYPQLHVMTNIPRQECSWVQLTIPDVRLPPALILAHRWIHWMAVQPSPGDQPAFTRLVCLPQNSLQLQGSLDEPALRQTWRYLQTILDLPVQLPLETCSLHFMPQAMTVFPSLVGTRAFRPPPASPIANLFFSGPWTVTSLPHSFESLTISANTCAQAVARMYFSRLR